MALMGMMQMVAHQIIDVIAVRHRLVPTTRAMPVCGIVSLAGMIGGAGQCICYGNLHSVFVHVIAMGMVEVTIVQVVNMIAMTDGGMATARAMPVRMIRMLTFVAIGHRL